MSDVRTVTVVLLRLVGDDEALSIEDKDGTGAKFSRTLATFFA